MKPPPSAWLVDLDGTLYRALPVKLCMALEVLALGRGALPVVWAFREQHERLRASGEAALDSSSPYRLQLERTAETLARPVDELEPLLRHWMQERPGRWIRHFRRRALLEEIAVFKRNGGSTALVSDYPASLKLAALGCGALFDAVVANGEAGGPPRLKPDPAGYLAAAERLGVAPADCLVLGDREDADGEAARRAGMGFRRIG